MGVTMIVAIAGSSGVVGKALVETMLLDIHFTKIYIFGRRNIFPSHKKIHYIETNFETFPEFPKDIDKAVCSLGTTIAQAGSKESFRKVDVEYVSNFARICLQNDAKAFSLVTAAGAMKTQCFSTTNARERLKQS